MKKIFQFSALAIAVSLSAMAVHADQNLSDPNDVNINIDTDFNNDGDFSVYSGAAFLINSNIISVSFISDNIGYYVNNKTELHKTINGSTTWSKIVTLPVYPSSVCFINEKIGFISTYEGKILETKDAGLNWKIVYNEPAERIFKIITKDNAVFAIGDNGLFLRKR